jgi:Na+-transporting NADH:ubiquinone oxidoreductase subunit C
VSPDGQTIQGVTIIRQEETPGLGGRISEQEYLDGFRGRSLDTAMEVKAPGKSVAPNEIDAITGATLSSVVFVDLLNDHIAEAIDVLRGGS